MVALWAGWLDLLDIPKRRVGRASKRSERRFSGVYAPLAAAEGGPPALFLGGHFGKKVRDGRRLGFARDVLPGSYLLGIFAPRYAV